MLDRKSSSSDQWVHTAFSRVSRIAGALPWDLILIGLFLLASLFYIYVVVSVAQFGGSENCKTAAQGDNCDLACRVFAYFRTQCKDLTINEIGDFFAGFLVPLTVMWFAVAFIWQARELSLQRAEYTRSIETALQQLGENRSRNLRDQEQQDRALIWEKAALARQQLHRIEAWLDKNPSYAGASSDRAGSASVAVRLKHFIDGVEQIKDIRLSELREKLHKELDDMKPSISLLSELVADGSVARLIPISSDDRELLLPMRNW